MMAAERYILAIAIDKYAERDFQPLQNAKRDAKRLLTVLTKKYGFKTVVGPLFDSDATRRKIIEVLNELGTSVTKDDTLVIFHAGHGVIHPTKRRGFWVPHEATRTLGDWISHVELIGLLEGIEAKHLCLITDSCFSGSIFSRVRGTPLADIRMSTLITTKSRWFLTSGREENVSDGKADEGSPFGDSLNLILEQNTRQYLPISDLALAVETQTARRSNQVPRWGPVASLGDEGGQLVFELVHPPVISGKPKKKTWEQNFELFVKARERRPEWPFISRANRDTKDLGTWCQDQRTQKRKGTLRKDREDRLIEVGFVFDPQIEKFLKGYTRFLFFMHKTGLNDVPTRLLNQYASEHAWHTQQQKWYEKAPCDPSNPKSYPQYRFDMLQKVGIPMETHDRELSWKQFQKDIQRFYENHPRRITIPSQTNPDPDIANLGKRVNWWMVRWKRNRLSKERIDFLEEYIDKDYLSNKTKRVFLKQIDAYLKFREEFPSENPTPQQRKRKDVKAVVDWKAQVNHRLGAKSVPANKWKIEELNKINFPWSNKKRSKDMQLELRLDLENIK